MNKLGVYLTLILALICVVAKAQSCSTFDEGVYDCTFNPTGSYDNDFNTEDFQFEIVNSTGNSVQSFQITDSSFCPNNDAGTLQIQNQTFVIFQIQNDCNYPLFNDNAEQDLLYNADFNSACNSFSGDIYDQSTGNKKGELNCSFQGNNNGSSSSASALIPSLLLIVFVALSLF